MQWLWRRNSPHILCISWLIDGKAGLFAGFAGEQEKPEAAGFGIRQLIRYDDFAGNGTALLSMGILCQSEQIVHAGFVVVGKLNQKFDGTWFELICRKAD